MQVTVLGTFIRDTIITLSKKKVHSIGGLFFTLQALSVLMKDSDKIYPVAYIGSDFYDTVLRAISPMKNVDTGGLVKYAGKNNAVTLEYLSESERQETSLYPLPPLPFEMVAPFLDINMLLVNMISGWDIELKTLQKIRQKYNGLIYLDVHSFLLGRRADGRRYYRLPANFENWLGLANFIQMNEMEFRILNQNKLSLEDFYRKYCISNRNLINLTLGQNGSVCIYFDRSKIRSFNQAANATKIIGEPTGCGDTFMAGFCVAKMQGKTTEECVDFANCVAAVNSKFEGTPDYYRFRNLISKESC